MVVTFFWTKNWQTLAALWAAHYRATRKNRESRTQLDEPVECASEGEPLLLYKFLHLWFEFFVHYALRVEKIINLVLMRVFRNFSIFFFGRGGVSSTHSELCRSLSRS